MSTPAKTRPPLKGETRTRADVSQATLDDPLYVAVSKTSENAVAWAAVGREYELTNQGYVPVRPEDVESMDGGQYATREKHFGVYFWFDKDAPIVKQGQHVLMQIPVKRREERQKQLSERMLSKTPQRTDTQGAEKARLEVHEETDLGSEMK